MQLLEHFKVLTIHPKNAKELKGLILQLAIQGKLTQKWREERRLSGVEVEPASVLLEKIQAEKEQLIKNKKIKKEKPLPTISDDETPHELPESWVWCYFDDISLKIGDVDHKMPNEVQEGFPYVSPRDFFEKNEIRFETAKKISKEDFENLSRKIQPKRGDIIFPRYGTIGDNRLVRTDIDFLASYSCAVIKHMIGYINSEFVFHYSLSPFVKTEIEKYINKTTQPNVGIKSIKQFLVPLPPLEEQKAIVEIVNQLFTEVEALEAQTVARIQLKEDFVTSALKRLSQVQEVNGEWAFLQELFKGFFNTTASVKKLRESILKLAVQGKLTASWRKENPEVESAEVLLKKIKAEKVQLIEEKKIKKEKPLTAITEEEIPYELPEGWVWCYFDDISLKIGDVDHKMPNEVQEGFPYVSPRDFFENNEIRFETAKKISKEDFENLSRKIQPERGDLIFPRYGTIGDNRLVRTDIDFLASYSCAVIKNMIGYINSEFVFHYSISPFVKSEIEKYINKTTQPNVGIKSIKQFLVPLPPLEEQKAIVAKVNSLMALCDQLEQQISQNTKQVEDLMQSCLRSALTADAAVFEGEEADEQEHMNMAAEPAGKYKNVKHLSTKPTNIDYYKRALLAAEIIWQLHQEPTLGHLKLQKLIYLCQESGNMQLPTNFTKQAAGPYDGQMARSLDKQLKEKLWFEYHEGELFKFKPLQNAGQHKKDFEKYFKDDLETINEIVLIFKTARSNQIELVATLFACWKDIKKKKELFSEELLINRFYDWSKEKQKFSKEKVNKAIVWMKEKGLFPSQI